MLERFFTPGTTIGNILRGLRQSHGPLGLLYGAYCPPDLHLQAEDEPDAPGQIGQIEVADRRGGQLLGASRTELPRPHQPCEINPSPKTPICRWAPMVRSIAPGALFDGRDDDVARFAMILDRPETRVLVLHGESGVGKTSFLRAGLIPYLEEDDRLPVSPRLHRRRGR